MNLIKMKILERIDNIKFKILVEADGNLCKIMRESEEYENEITSKSNKLNELKNEIIKKENELEFKKLEIDKNNIEVNSILTKINELEKQYQDCKDFGPEIPEAYGLYDRVLLLENSTVYKKRIDDIREKEKELIKEKRAIVTENTWKVNDSKREGNKLINRITKIALRAFNGECDAIIESVKSYSKKDSKRNKIVIVYNTINGLIETLSQRITQKYLQLKMDELEIVFDYENALMNEKEETKKQREIERDEEIAHKEFQQEIRRIEKEKTHFSNEIEEMINRMKESEENEREKFREKIKILESKIEELNKKKEDFQNRFANKAGYVYVISNIGSFGEGIFKIGTTRRIDPFERINELSNASVPFKFDQHAIIFSENCYELEHEMHKRFEKNRVNKVNLWKEYYKIDVDELDKELLNFDKTVKICIEPAAVEYKQTKNFEK